MSETELVERARAGDERAARRLYDDNVDRVYRLAYRMTGDAEAAREYTQATFVRAFERLNQFRGDAALSTWLHAITVSTTLNGLRRTKRMNTRETELDEGLTGGPTPSPEPGLRERLHRAIDGLPDLYRTVFVMHDVEGYTHDEIGVALDVATGTSKARLFRARRLLRAELSEYAEEFAV